MALSFDARSNLCVRDSDFLCSICFAGYNSKTTGEEICTSGWPVTGTGATLQALRGAAGAANSICCARRRGGGVGSGNDGCGGNFVGDAAVTRRRGGGAGCAGASCGSERRAIAQFRSC